MEASSTIGPVSLQAIGGYYRTVTGTYSAGGIDAVVRDHGLVLITITLAILVVVLLVVVLFMPSKRKVVRKRRVRVTRQAVASTVEAAQEPAQQPEDAEAPEAPAPSKPRWSQWIVPLVAGLVVVVAFAATYVVTGSDAYCARTCHVEDPTVAKALEVNHGDCVDCHEGGLVSGASARLRMAVAYTLSAEATGAPLPVDASRCLGCHQDVASNVVDTTSGLRVSHKEVLAGGRTCMDCHTKTGHSEGFSLLSGGMDRCTVCHDGKIASAECDTCHVDGSPLARKRTVNSSTSTFTFTPVQVANRDCSRCHGAEEKCVNCHNGFILPHDDEFRAGGHGRIAAFDGKERCYKCHTLAWCGGECHGAFSPHDPQLWPKEHQRGSSATCGSCHVAWDGTGDWCDVCH